MLHSAGCTICINTANGSALVKKKFELEGLGEYISDVVGGDIQGSKAEKIISMMKKYNFTAETTWMIGDTQGDIIEGKKAGVNTAAVTYGWHSYDNMLAQEPDHILKQLKNLKSF